MWRWSWNTALEHHPHPRFRGIWYLVEVEVQAEPPVEGVGGVLTVEVHPQLEGEDGLRQRIAVPAGQRDDPRNKNIVS